MPLEPTIGLLLLAITVTVAVVRPLGVPEGLIAAPAATIALLTGAVSPRSAGHALRQMFPTVAFLATILAFSHLCAAAGVFEYLGGRVASWSGARPRRLLALVVVFAAGVTATLTLDSTVVLVTPVVLASTRRLGVRTRPHSYACVHLANSGSLLLPVSNLTNLLAFSASGLSFGRFAALMVLPWLIACTLDWLTLRVAFRADLADSGRPVDKPTARPTYPLVVLGCTVGGFVLASAAGIAPAWAALAGCAVLGVREVRSNRTTLGRTLGAASPGFCVFVLGLAVLVAGVLDHGGRGWLRHITPSGSGLITLLALAFLAAALAAVLNNLPATLALLPLLAGSPLAVLAVLIGVNAGPNAAYPGSLATLLWRRNLQSADKPRALEFHVIGLISTPFVIAAATVALWLVAGPLGLR